MDYRITKKKNTRSRHTLAMLLAATVVMAPTAQAQNFYLARAIGEPAPTAPPAPARARNVSPQLPELGTEPRTPAPVETEQRGSTWKWVVGVAIAAAVVALANGGGKSGGGGRSSPAGNDGGGGGGGGDGGGSPILPIPNLPIDDDDD